MLDRELSPFPLLLDPLQTARQLAPSSAALWRSGGGQRDVLCAPVVTRASRRRVTMEANGKVRNAVFYGETFSSEVKRRL